MTKSTFLKQAAIELTGLVILGFYVAIGWVLWGNLEVICFVIAGSAFLNSVRTSIKLKLMTND